MRNSLLIGACLAAALCACSKQETASSATETAQSPAASAARVAGTPQQPPTSRRQQPLTPEEIAGIKATGRSGLWSEPGAFCTGATRQQATLFWNTQGKGVNGVIISLMDKAGHERRFGQGGAIGRKTTGHWLKSGTTFFLRDKATKTELGKLVIAGKQC